MSKLPSDLQKIVEDSFAEAALQQRKDSTRANSASQSVLTKQGLVFNSPEHASFVAALRASDYYKHWKSKFGAQEWGLLESALGKKLA